MLISVAFLTLLERKVLRLLGVRLGPNKVSFLGIFQPISDALKLSNKQFNVLFNSSIFFYYYSSFFIIFCRLILFSFFFLDPLPLSLKFRLLFFFLVLAFNSLNSIISGWRTFRKFSLIGRIRTVTQLISYEAVLYLCIFFLIICISRFSFISLSFLPIIYFFFIPYCFYIWIPIILAELNRTPYDFSEGESELVRGFNTEFGSFGFTLIFLSEYSNIIFFCILTGFIFFFRFFIFFFFLFFIIWIRSILPRFRFDKLILLAWKFFIPFLTIFFLIFLTYFC